MKRRTEEKGRIDWDWLGRQPAVATALDGAVRHVRPLRPLRVVVNGPSGLGVILEETSRISPRC